MTANKAMSSLFPILEFLQDVTICAASQIYIAPHFAQPNSIEYQPALEWRRLQRAARVFKRLQREDHTVKLANVMREYLQVHPSVGSREGPTTNTLHHPPRPKPLDLALRHCIWLDSFFGGALTLFSRILHHMSRTACRSRTVTRPVYFQLWHALQDDSSMAL